MSKTVSTCGCVWVRNQEFGDVNERPCAEHTPSREAIRAADLAYFRDVCGGNRDDQRLRQLGVFTEN
jgi:hypothetical protein